MANVLPMAKRVEVIAHLVEGAGIRPTSRITGVSKPAILSLLARIGEGCERLHDRLVRDLDIRSIQCDELWSFIQKKQARLTPEDDPEHGDAYTFIALAKASKLVIAYRTGKRDEENTDLFIADLRARLLTLPQLSTDGFQAYPMAIGQSFGGMVDYAIVQKTFPTSPRPEAGRYEPARNPLMQKRRVFGVPDMREAGTSHVERGNLTIRMQIRRFTRLCNGFSKKLDNHRAAVALHMAFYNFCRIHETIRCTPAMEAGIADRVWSVDELVAAALEEPEGEQPVKKPLALPHGAGTARQTSSGAWLRVVDGGQSSAAAPAPEPVEPPPVPAAPGGTVTETVVTVEPSGQLSLLDWRPKPREPKQLSLFGP
jgi:IS1 family transposase